MSNSILFPIKTLPRFEDVFNSIAEVNRHGFNRHLRVI